VKGYRESGGDEIFYCILSFFGFDTQCFFKKLFPRVSLWRRFPQTTRHV
jgi:hypothetical protein